MVQCPECGTNSKASRLKKDGRRFKFGNIGLVFLTVAVVTGYLGPVRNGTWTRVVPTYPLVILTDTSFGMTRTDLRKEIVKRVRNGSVNGRSARALAKILAKDLRNDGIWGSASSAMSMLKKLWPDSIEALSHETMVGDGQSKALAAQMLRQRIEVPSEILLVACVSDLHDDGDVDGWEMMEGNARQAAEYLLRWWSISSQYVLEAIESSDEQQRFLAATIAGFAGSTEKREMVVNILFPHLLDNSFYGDAKIAAPAIYHLGPKAVPLLQQKLKDADDQARSILLHIIERLENPERAFNHCKNPLPKLTSRAKDPLEAPLSTLMYNFWFVKDSNGTQ
ncbi:MAG: hypothetical protein H8E83_06795 [Planctomycetes bacterium]|nr:hypothetical protein [Planctomycetota bacterium]